MNGCINGILLILLLICTSLPLSAAESTLPAHGGTTGSRYNFDCKMFGNNYVMVGISGRASNYIEQIQARCIKVDRNGNWNGSVKLTGAAGGSSTSRYIRQCDKNYAVSRVTGRAGSTVTNLRVGCRKLGPNGTFSNSSVSSTTMKPSVGGSGGTVWGPDNCPDNKPARRVKGRVETVNGRTMIRQVQFSCDNPYKLPTFGDTLASSFQHPRCTNCHAFNSSSGLGRTTHANNGNNCTGCHTSSITGTSVWFAPSTSMNFSGLSSSRVCEMIKQGKFSNPAEMKHHLKEDALIVWAIINAKVPPNGNTLSKASSGNLTNWKQNVDSWVDSGMNCQ